MEKQSIRQLQGLAELLRDVTVAASGGIETAHADTARGPYVVLDHIPLVRAPAARIRRIQFGITAIVYRSIRVVAIGSAFVAAHALAAVEHRATGE